MNHNKLDGHSLVRYPTRFNEGPQPVVSSGAAIADVAEHLRNYIGQLSLFLAEVVSDGFELQIQVVRPTDVFPYWSLMTAGMSDHGMAVPSVSRSPNRLELVMFLPGGWDMSDAGWREERNYCPVRTLSWVAHFPQRHHAWIGAFHSLPNGDPPSPYDESTPYYAVMLVPPIRLPTSFGAFDNVGGGTVSVLALLPLQREELDLKLSMGTDDFLDRLDAAGLDEFFDPDRASLA